MRGVGALTKTEKCCTSYYLRSNARHLIKKINEYVDDIVEDKEKSKELSHGHRLAGNVTQEFKLEPEFMKEINL